MGGIGAALSAFMNNVAALALLLAFAGGSAAWAWGGWPAVCGFAASLTAAALAAHLAGGEAPSEAMVAPLVSDA